MQLSHALDRVLSSGLHKTASGTRFAAPKVVNSKHHVLTSHPQRFESTRVQVATPEAPSSSENASSSNLPVPVTQAAATGKYSSS